MGLGCLKSLRLFVTWVVQGANGFQALGGVEPLFGRESHFCGVESLFAELGDQCGLALRQQRSERGSAVSADCGVEAVGFTGEGFAGGGFGVSREGFGEFFFEGDDK